MNMCDNIIVVPIGNARKTREKEKDMKKYKNKETGRVALLVVDNLTKTMKYEDDGSEVIITPASLKHEWVFLGEEEVVEPKPEEKPVEPVVVPVEVKPEPEEPKVEVPVEYMPVAPRVKLKNGKRIVGTNSRGGTMARRKARHTKKNS